MLVASMKCILSSIWSLANLLVLKKMSVACFYEHQLGKKIFVRLFQHRPIRCNENNQYARASFYTFSINMALKQLAFTFIFDHPKMILLVLLLAANAVTGKK